MMDSELTDTLADLWETYFSQSGQEEDLERCRQKEPDHIAIAAYEELESLLDAVLANPVPGDDDGFLDLHVVDGCGAEDKIQVEPPQCMQVDEEELDACVPVKESKKERSRSRPKPSVRLHPFQKSQRPQNCQVCGFPCPRHRFYGGVTCNSCRVFFRRCVQSGGYKVFFCQYDNACEIDSKSWKSCQACRFHRCVSEAGMRVELVATEPREKNWSSAKAKAAAKKRGEVAIVKEDNVL